MIVDNTLNNRQPQPGAAGTAGAIAAYKRLKQMFALLRFDPRPVIFHLEPGPARFAAAADLDPAIAIAGRVDHHIRQRALDRQRVHTYRNFAGLQGGGDFPLIAALRSDHFPQHRIQIRQLHRHLLPGAQIVDKLLDDGVALFDIFVDRLREIAVLLAHHLGGQTNAGQRSS